jgi:YidC/Oxa1 family membrane protein insertase
MKKSKKLLILLIAVFLLTGCAKQLKDSEGKIVQVPETGQTLISNILCQPTKESTIKLYKENNVDLSKLPKCSAFKPTSGGYEGVWNTVFVKPLAWIIIKLGKYVKNYGLAIILVTLALRLIVMPVTKKTAMQSENMKKAGPELEKLEAKYKDAQGQQEMMMKSQEMLAIYKKYNISPMSGCIFALIQIPLFFAFYESMNRLPVVFEGTFLKVFNLGTSPLSAIQHGEWQYLILVVLVALATYFSFKMNKTASMNSEQAKSMAMTTNIMVIFIIIASFSISTSIALYWIFNSGFTIVQNLLVKRGK